MEAVAHDQLVLADRAPQSAEELSCERAPDLVAGGQLQPGTLEGEDHDGRLVEGGLHLVRSGGVRSIHAKVVPRGASPNQTR